MSKKKPPPPSEAATIERLNNLYRKIRVYEAQNPADDDVPWQWVDDAAGAVSDLLDLYDNANPRNTALTLEQVQLWVGFYNALQDAVDSDAQFPGKAIPPIPAVSG